MKKVLVLLAALVLLVVCSACSNKEETTNSSDSGSKDKSSAHKTIQLKVGDIFSFGHYEQDNNLDNGPEPIEWKVLDVQDGKALLLSRYGLDVEPYNRIWTYITWENCTLRTWLNGTFLNEAFSAQEQNGILTTSVDNSRSQGYSVWEPDGGNNTQDKIFLLSYAEANKYFDVTSDNIKNTNSRIAPTAYAIEQGAETFEGRETADGTDAGRWWLRSPGVDPDSAAIVDTVGALDNNYVDNDCCCVRPALWINLESDIF